MLEQTLAISNELLLVALAIVVACLGLLPGRKPDGRLEVTVATSGLLLLLVFNAINGFPAISAFGGAYKAGPVAQVFKCLFLLSGALTALLSWPANTPRPALPGKLIGEHLSLLLLSITGMCFLVSAQELVLLYVSLELVTIPLILLVAFNRHELRSAEASMKYVLFSALSSGLLLYGLSIVYGLAGTTDLTAIAPHLHFSLPAIMALTLIMAGVGFKISAVPFHLWAPDTYEGAPTPVAAFLSVASKAAGFALFYKLVSALFGHLADTTVLLLGLLATVTMTAGNLMAIHQTNMKRFLAYSSIAQAGYLLIGLSNDGELGLAAVSFYLLVYVVSNLAAFGVVTFIAAATGKEDMRDYVGFSVNNPALAAVMMLAMFSLAGIPPLAGFLGKFYLFAAAAQKGYYWLVLVGTVNATISLYYYLVVLKHMYLKKPENGQTPIGRMNISWAGTIALAISCAAMLVVGILPHFLRWTESAAAIGW